MAALFRPHEEERVRELLGGLERPVELLLALGRWGALRDLLVRIFRAQNPDGDWPQWFTFFERDRGIRAGDSHGDIVFWPLVALAQYLLASDDFALLDAIEADISLDQCIDNDHVFVTGFSMGGYFSHHVGCMRDDIRAVAPHSGGTHALDNCSVAKKPIIIFHGKADPVIPTGCNDPESTHVANVTPAADAWAIHNGCATTYTKHSVTGGTCFHYDNCPTGGQVELCTFDNMAHCWAGGAQGAGIFSCPAYEKATQLEWQFWKTYAWD